MKRGVNFLRLFYIYRHVAIVDAKMDLPAKMVDAAKTVEKNDYSYDETEYEILDDDYSSVEDLGGRTDDWKDHHDHE